MDFPTIKYKLSRCSAGIAGAGGLGSNCAASLVRVGIGRLVICDFDIVEESNLNRQFYFHDQIGLAKIDALKSNLLRINSKLVITTHRIRLDPSNIPELFADVDVLFEAFDLADQKTMLIETALSTWPDRPLIAGSGMAGYGGFEKLGVHRSGNLIICGDGNSEASDDLPPIAPRVNIVSNMMANAGIEILLRN